MLQRIFLLFVTILILSCEDPNQEVIDTGEPEEPILCEQSICWDNKFYVCRDSTYIKLFTRNKGWTGGDATYSVNLKNGKTLWMFGDSFIDQVSANRSRPSFRLINNCLVLQDGNNLTTYHKGTTVNPKAFAKPPEETDWYWPGDATVADGKIYLFMHGFSTGGGGAWDFFRTSIDLLTLNLETLEIENNSRLFDDPSVSWGAAILEDTDYTYVYGVRSDQAGKRLLVARSNANLTDTWEYFTGSGWSLQPEDATEIYSGVSEQFSIFKRDNVYYFVTQHNIFGKQIYILNSSAPQGPFEDRRVMYCTPETGGNIFTYNAFVHDHIYNDSLLVSYNVNSFDYTDLLKSADNYRPYFVKVGGWKK
ncbi:MAG TPA: DUF5005 domain-containing protein [Cyclobacteriaceae bacterium]|jgi:hypothetical protein|nr:DUF5005 domain-containing protein [Cytophagales bacterium]HRF32672.1 DUF5005 domain-containing protein [Cyclobacteriaceae bacterium]